MKNRFLLGIVAVWFVSFVALTTAQAAVSKERQQIIMLQELFRRELPDWKRIMEGYKDALDDDFFLNCEKRIRWAVNSNHVDDAVRFAMVADMGAEVMNRKALYRFGLAEAFYKARNRAMAGELLDNILITSPNVVQARFLRAKMLLDKQEFQKSYEDFSIALDSDYRPGESLFYMSQISELAGQRVRGERELQRAVALNDPKAKALVARRKNLEQEILKNADPDQPFPFVPAPGEPLPTDRNPANKASEESGWPIERAKTTPSLKTSSSQSPTKNNWPVAAESEPLNKHQEVLVDDGSGDTVKLLTNRPAEGVSKTELVTLPAQAQPDPVQSRIPKKQVVVASTGSAPQTTVSPETAEVQPEHFQSLEVAPSQNTQRAKRLYDYALRLRRRGAYSKSASTLQEAETLDPDNRKYRREMAYLFLDLKKDDLAVKRLEKMTQEDAKDAMTWAQLAWTYRTLAAKTGLNYETKAEFALTQAKAWAGEDSKVLDLIQKAEQLKPSL